MSTAVIETLRSERDEARNAAIALAETDNFQADDETFAELQARAATLDGRIGKLADLLDSQRAADSMDSRLALTARQRQSPVQVREGGDLGEMFTRSDEFSAWQGIGSSSRFSGPGLLTRAPILTGDLPLPAAFAGYAAPPNLQAPLLQLLQDVPVSSGAVEWIYYGTTTSPAAPVVPEGTLKPETTVPMELRTAALDTYAHHLEYSRQFRDDAATLVALINGALRKGVIDGVEAGTATVIGAEPNWLDAQGADLLSAIRVGVGLVQGAGFTPSAVVLNPADYAQIDLDIMNGTLHGPVGNGSLWGVPAVPVGAIPEGTAYVADWMSAMWLFNRGTVDVFTTDSHASNFTSNIFTVLAEQRAKPVVIRPEAGAKCTVAPPLVTGSSSKKA